MKRHISFRARNNLMERGEDGVLTNNTQHIALKTSGAAPEPIKPKSTKNTNKKRRKNRNKRKGKK